jgi:hypothetical protein
LPGGAGETNLPEPRGATGKWCGAWVGWAAGGGGVGGVRGAPGRGGWRRPAGTGPRSTAAAPSSSAPPSRPSRPPNPRTARTCSTVLQDRGRRVVSQPRAPSAYPVFVADPDRVHHDDPPSHAGVVAVSVSLRHQRSSVTTHRPPAASSRSATGRTRSPFQTTATVSARPRQVT